MKILLDTHILLWSLFETKKLSKEEKQTITDYNQDILVSSVTLWEISIKYSLGKLNLRSIDPGDLPKIIEQTGFEMIDMNDQEASTFHQLPQLHKDPFDRMLIWQAIDRNLRLMTHDKEYKHYKKFGLKLF